MLELHILEGWSTKDWVAVWGAVLSTLLGAVKLLELWWARHRIEVDFVFRSSEIEGNTIFVRNLSNRPIIVTHWELFAARNKLGKSEVTHLATADHDEGDRHVAANSSFALNFSEENYFSTRPKFLTGRPIFIRLWVAGRKPSTHQIYP